MFRSLGPLTGAMVVQRARSILGARTVYRLGAGGRDPRAKTPRALVVSGPGAPGMACDCSGFAAWCVGVDRYLPNDGIPDRPFGDWFETSALYRDALSPFGFVTALGWSEARPGDLVVYPDVGTHEGHVGVVATLTEDGGPLTVVHCSAGNWRRFGDAILETAPDVFMSGAARVARVAWVVA